MKTLAKLILAGLVATGLFASTQQVATSDSAAPVVQPDSAVISRIIDGDTYELTNGTKIRAVGVDTPEVHGGKECYGPEASAFVKSLVPPGTEVKLSYDRAEGESGHTDRYGRTLAYVTRMDGLSVNAELIRTGHARVMMIRPNVSHQVEYEGLQMQAQTNKAGLWGVC